MVVYADASQEETLAVASVPAIHHLAGIRPGRSTRTDALTVYYYPNVESYKFATPFQSCFHYTTEAISHTRSIKLLKQHMSGPYFDLELIWDEHTYYEFADRSVEHTMSTMVQEPYVNHVPVVCTSFRKPQPPHPPRAQVRRGVSLEILTLVVQLTGGVGRGPLSNFYRHNFIFNNSADTALELISRTVGIDRIVDEFIFKFTHDMELDWL